MVKKKITVSDVAKGNLKIVSYLLVSGALGYVLATYVVGNEALTMILTPAINYIMWLVEQELRNKGVRELLKK